MLRFSWKMEILNFYCIFAEYIKVKKDYPSNAISLEVCFGAEDRRIWKNKLIALLG